MTRKLTEDELLERLDSHTAHADEVATPTSNELTPLERLQGSVLDYSGPTEPIQDWGDDSNEDAP